MATNINYVKKGVQFDLQGGTTAPAVVPVVNQNPSPSPATPTYTTTNPTVTKPATTVQDLSGQYGLNNGTVYDKSTNTGLDLNTFAGRMGMDPSKINWNSLKFDDKYAPPVAKTPTNGEIFGTAVIDPAPAKVFQYNGSGADPDQAVLDNLLKQAGVTATGPVDEEAIRKNTLAQFQAEIDAVNQLYADRLARAKVSGEGRIGQGRAINARSGLLGSDMGASNDATIRSANEDIYRGIEEERAAKIAGIVNNARSAAATEIAAKNAAKQQGYSNYISFLSSATSRKQSNVSKIVKAILAQGLDIKEIDPKQLQKIASDLGVGTEDVLTAYVTEKAAQAKAAAETAKDSRVVVPEGGTYVDAATGKVLASGSPKLPDSAREYEYAKANGYTGTYEQYQNEDANRKAKAAAAANGLSNSQATLFNSIVNQYNKSPLVAAADRTIVLKDTINKVKKDPGNAALQLNLSYAYIQALDTYQSSVREGELGNLNSIDSKIGKLSNYVEQMQNGQIVRPDVAKQIADAAESLVNVISEGAKNKAKSFQSQATTLGLGDAWNSYIGGFTPTYDNTGNSDAGGANNPWGGIIPN